MKTLPKTIAGTASKRHRLQLANWLREWQIDCLIRPRTTQPVDRAILTGTTTGTSACCDFLPTTGQIILLPPSPVTRAAERPIYVLVLKKVHDAFLVAPFSRFATPAIRGEWKAGLRAKPLRVLCVWNTQLVSSRALSTGWPSTVTKLQTVERALEVHRHIHDGNPLAYVTERELGPPLQHPLDPRHAYQEEESSLLAEHLVFMEARSNDASTVFPYEQKPGPLLLAAETRARYKTQRKNRKPHK